MNLALYAEASLIFGTKSEYMCYTYLQTFKYDFMRLNLSSYKLYLNSAYQFDI